MKKEVEEDHVAIKDHKENEDIRDRLDRKGILGHLVQKEIGDPEDIMDWKESQAGKENGERKVNEEKEDLEVSRGLLDHKENGAKEDLKVSKDQLDHKGNAGLPGRLIRYTDMSIQQQKARHQGLFISKLPAHYKTSKSFAKA